MNNERQKLINEIRYYGKWLDREYKWIDKCSIERLESIMEKLKDDICKRGDKMWQGYKKSLQSSELRPGKYREPVKGFEWKAERDYLDYQKSTLSE